MQINRVELKNYRVHKDLQVDFAPGINLLLGKNGSGKSSILEAIGIAMFSNSPRSSLSEAVSEGEKSGSILVEFLGNDEVEYIVEKKIGSTNRHSFYKKGSEEEKITDSAEIIKKIKSLCGIPKDSKNIFESVISASQNKIVDIFLGSEGDRESIFNEIFDTKIYREIFEKYSLEAENNYNNKLNKLKGNFESLSGNLIDIKSVREFLQNLRNEKKIEENKKTNILEKAEKLESQKGYFDKIKNDLDAAKKEAQSKQELLEAKKENYKEVENELTKSIGAQEIIQNTKVDYEKYKLFADEIKVLEQRLRNLAQKKQKIVEIKDEINKLKEESIVLEKDIENQDINLDEKNKLLQKEENILDEKMQNLQNLQEKEKIYKKELLDLNDIIGKYQKEFDKQKVTEERIKNFSRIIEEFEQKDFSEDKIQEHLQKIEAEYLENQKKLEEKKGLVKKLEELKTIWKEIEKSKKELEQGICPILKEKCKNISSDFSFKENIFSRQNKLKKSGEAINTQLIVYQNVEIQEKELFRQKTALEEKLKTYFEEKQKIEIRKREMDLAKKDLENVELKMQNLLKTDQIINFDKKKDELNRQQYEIELKLQELKINEKKKDVEEVQNEIESLKKQIFSIENSQKQNKKKLESVKIIISEKEQEKEIFIGEIKDFDEINAKYEMTKDEQNSLKVSYEKYIQNIEGSRKVDFFEKRKGLLSKEIEEIRENIEKAHDNINSLAERYSKEEYDKILLEKKDLDTQKEELIFKLSALDEKIEVQKSVIKEFKKQEEEIKSLKNNIKIFEQKIDLTRKLREYLKPMGKEVASTMLEEIAIKATENFREITGRSEEIKWENSYTVYLVEGKDRKKFNMLSGGEQVAVAIAIRAALSSTLSQANFSIFDEPTNNLDEERRKSLADSLSIILKGIEQSIIVTHDDTFQEMAEKIIYLEG